jgi:hypothetical protein
MNRLINPSNEVELHVLHLLRLTAGIYRYTDYYTSFYPALSLVRHSGRLLGPIGALVVVNRALCLSAVGKIRGRSVDGNGAAFLRAAVDLCVCVRIAWCVTKRIEKKNKEEYSRARSTTPH